MLAATPGSGYLYELLKKLGLDPSGAETAQRWLGKPIEVLFVAVATVLIAYIGSRLILRALKRGQRLRGDTASGRVETAVRIIANAWRVVVGVIGLLTILAVVGINLTPLLAGATVIGATIGFGAQSLVRDFLSGLLMLLEDQFRIGDLVTVNDITGTVEEVSLRVTRLRAADGTAWYIPNGQILRLGNSSRHWASAKVEVMIANDAPITAARAAIEEAAKEAITQPGLAGMVRSAPRVLGVSAVAPEGVTMAVSIETAPRAVDDVSRVLRTEIIERLAKEKMLPTA